MPHQIEDHPAFILMTMAGPAQSADLHHARDALLETCAKSGKALVLINLSRLITRGTISYEELIDLTCSWPRQPDKRLTVAIILPRDTATRDDIHFFHAAIYTANTPIDARLFEPEETHEARGWLVWWGSELKKHHSRAACR